VDAGRTGHGLIEHRHGRYDVVIGGGRGDQLDEAKLDEPITTAGLKTRRGGYGFCDYGTCRYVGDGTVIMW
jgi:hypothetical protein